MAEETATPKKNVYISLHESFLHEGIKYTDQETGEEKTILFGLTGTGYFDMVAYQRYNDGEMEDYVPADAELEKAIAKLPKVSGQQ